MAGFTSTAVYLCLRLLIIFASYVFVKGVYRITFHPLAKFPGPKRAAISELYGALWDIPLRTSYVKEFAKWHDKYDSPIVRIEPNHLHIRDIDSYNEIYRMGTKFIRDQSFYSLPYTVGSYWNRCDAQGSAHRALFNQYFSKSAVQSLEPLFQDNLRQFLMKLHEAGRQGVPVDLTMGFRCMAADTIARYMWNKPMGFLDAPGFKHPTIIQLEKLTDQIPVGWYGGKPFTWMVDLSQRIPRSWLGESGVSATLTIFDECKARIFGLSKTPLNKMEPNIFQTALYPSIEKGQPKVSLDALAADALVMFTAGSESTANITSYCIYHVLQQPKTVLAPLRAELATAIPRSATVAATAPSTPLFPLPWTTLEKLPFLRAVVKEALRIGYGVPGKIPRVVPPGGVILAGRKIPAGTKVSSSSYVYYTDPKCYPDPLSFRPERWLSDGDTKSTDKFKNNGGVDPEKYFMTFGRGSRSCLGTNLAYAEIYAAVAYLIRNFDLELFETTPEDMDWHDSFIAVPFGHLKVKVTGLVD